MPPAYQDQDAILCLVDLDAYFHGRPPLSETVGGKLLGDLGISFGIEAIAMQTSTAARAIKWFS